jgi:hypothetical protein
MYIRIFGREITKYTVTYGVYIRFWPTLNIYHLFYLGTYLYHTITILYYLECLGTYTLRNTKAPHSREQAFFL